MHDHTANYYLSLLPSGDAIEIMIRFRRTCDFDWLFEWDKLFSFLDFVRRTLALIQLSVTCGERT